MAAARWTSHPSVTVDCPVCGRPLPRVLVDVDARADLKVVDGQCSRRLLALDVRVQELDAAWWDAARAEHPECIPPDTGRRPVITVNIDPPRDPDPVVRRYPYAGPYR